MLQINTFWIEDIPTVDIVATPRLIGESGATPLKENTYLHKQLTTLLKYKSLSINEKIGHECSIDYTIEDVKHTIGLKGTEYTRDLDDSSDIPIETRVDIVNEKDILLVDVILTEYSIRPMTRKELVLKTLPIVACNNKGKLVHLHSDGKITSTNVL